MQSKRQSLIETLSNTTLGMFGSWLITLGCMLWIDDKWLASIVIVALCTVWSLVRGYGVRRYFNGRHHEST